jgi:hypothetical protein
MTRSGRIYSSEATEKKRDRRAFQIREKKKSVLLSVQIRVKVLLHDGGTVAILPHPAVLFWL